MVATTGNPLAEQLVNGPFAEGCLDHRGNFQFSTGFLFLPPSFHCLLMVGTVHMYLSGHLSSAVEVYSRRGEMKMSMMKWSLAGNEENGGQGCRSRRLPGGGGASKPHMSWVQPECRVGLQHYKYPDPSQLHGDGTGWQLDGEMTGWQLVGEMTGWQLDEEMTVW